MPSRLNELYWKYTNRDIQTKLKITLGFEHAKAVQQYEAIALVVSQAFGGEGGKSSESSESPVQSLEQAQAQLNNVFGKN